MAHMWGKEKISDRDFVYSLQLTNWVLDSGETRHMTPHIFGFIPD